MPMDALVVSSSNSPSPAPIFSPAGNLLELDFVSCDVVPDQWMGGQAWLDEPLDLDGAAWADEGSGGSASAAGNDDVYGEPPPPAPKRRRGRKPGPRTNGPVISHVEAERQRRDKLNRRFCELRSAVPTVSRMDKASLLADAASYIAELRDRVEQLEAEAKQASAATTVAAAHPFAAGGLEENLEVRMLGREAAALRLTSAARHAPARLMLALRSLDLAVQNACVCRVGGATVQDAVVDVPAALRDERGLRAALLHKLQRSV